MRIISILILAFTLLSCNGQAQNGNSEKKVIGPKEFKAEMQKEDDYYLIDVRTPQEYKSGTLEGAKNINIYDSDFSAQLDQLDKEKAVYVFCAVGGRSGQAAKILENKGFKKIIDLKGGYNAWSRINP